MQTTNACQQDTFSLGLHNMQMGTEGFSSYFQQEYQMQIQKPVVSQITQIEVVSMCSRTLYYRMQKRD